LKKILVIRGGAIGDFVLTLPVLAALRAHYPNATIDILGYPRIASLAVASRLANQVAALESPALAGFFSRDGHRNADTANYFAQFDLILSFLYDPGEIFQSNVARCSSANFLIGPHRPDESLQLHATEQLLTPLKTLGIRNSDSRPRLLLPGVTPIKSNSIALHPGSGSILKNWPEENWKELLELLAIKSNRKFLFIGGEAEGERCERLSKIIPPERVEIAQNLPLVELAQRMKSCAGFIGHDSGITHIAAALDLSGLVLWGPCNAQTWRPQSEKFKLLQHPEGLARLPVETVLEKTLKLA
jgi:heptosyltransferase III